MSWIRNGFAMYIFFLVAVMATNAQQADLAASPETNVVPTGTRFLVGLQNNISSDSAKAGDRFEVRTLEPLPIENGMILPPGIVLRGHVDKVTAGHKTGHARLWLTFDDVRTPRGNVPIVADLIDVPGVHSIKVDYDREGEIEMRTDKRQQEMEAAAAGAFVGAAAGVASHNGKEAAEAAAAGAAAAFMVSSGLGQELHLEKGLKLELILGRPLYIARN